MDLLYLFTHNKYSVYETCAVLCRFNHIQFFATLWMVGHQAPLTMGFSRQEYWSGLPCPPQGIFPTQGTEIVSSLLH